MRPAIPFSEFWSPQIPASPTQGILGPLDADAWFEHDRDAGRAYLGTLWYWKPGQRGGKVDAEWFHSELHRSLYAEMKDAFPWQDGELTRKMAYGPTAARFGAPLVRNEIACCMDAAHPWKDMDGLVDALKAGWRRRQVEKVVDTLSRSCHDMDAVREAADRLKEIAGDVFTKKEKT